MSGQEANFQRNFDRLAIDWLLSTGNTHEAKRHAKLADRPLPVNFAKFETVGAAVSRMLDGDLGPLIKWCHKNRYAGMEAAQTWSRHKEAPAPPFFRFFFGGDGRVVTTRIVCGWLQ